jgi:hypothetical protein
MRCASGLFGHSLLPSDVDEGVGVEVTMTLSGLKATGWYYAKYNNSNKYHVVWYDHLKKTIVRAQEGGEYSPPRRLFDFLDGVISPFIPIPPAEELKGRLPCGLVELVETKSAEPAKKSEAITRPDRPGLWWGKGPYQETWNLTSVSSDLSFYRVMGMSGGFDFSTCLWDNWVKAEDGPSPILGVGTGAAHESVPAVNGPPKVDPDGDGPYWVRSEKFSKDYPNTRGWFLAILSNGCVRLEKYGSPESLSYCQGRWNFEWVPIRVSMPGTEPVSPDNDPTGSPEFAEELLEWQKGCPSEVGFYWCRNKDGLIFLSQIEKVRPDELIWMGGRMKVSESLGVTHFARRSPLFRPEEDYVFAAEEEWTDLPPRAGPYWVKTADGKVKGAKAWFTEGNGGWRQWHFDYEGENARRSVGHDCTALKWLARKVEVTA